jgi:hypothetical protein
VTPPARAPPCPALARAEWMISLLPSPPPDPPGARRGRPALKPVSVILDTWVIPDSSATAPTRTLSARQRRIKKALRVEGAGLFNIGAVLGQHANRPSPRLHLCRRSADPAQCAWLGPL